MEENLKQLLLKDLCARLPYGVCVHVRYKEGEPCYGKLAPRDIQWFIDSKIEVIKPYLRPWSSMTEEELNEWEDFLIPSSIKTNDGIKAAVLIEEFSKVLHFLNSHHFDYRSLIEKNLALEAPEGMYKIN